MTIFGYARVSTDGQDLTSQRTQLKAAGATKIFEEKESGSKTDRRELGKVIAKLSDGDALIVTRLDRLARSTRDLLNTLHAVAERKAAFKSLSDAWADTSTPHGKLMLTVLGGLAEFELQLIKTRTSEGRKRAKADGVRFGRKPKLTGFQFNEAKRRAELGESERAIARTFNVSQTTVHRALSGQTMTADFRGVK
jgi:DNA invertase Pin-like site-specific DNA recombinase